MRKGGAQRGACVARGGGAGQVSAQKFSLLKEFVAVGCSVLLTDTDVVYLQNPFGASTPANSETGLKPTWN